MPEAPSRLASVICGGATAIFVVLVLVGSTGAALAAPASVVVDTSTPQLEAEGTKYKLSFVNITDGPAILRAKVLAPAGCEQKLGTNRLRRNEITDVEVTVSGTCPEDEAMKVRIVAKMSGGISEIFKIEPQGDTGGKPDWSHLWAFAIMLGISLALATVFLYKGWDRPAGSASGRSGKSPGAKWSRFRDRFAQHLTELDVSSWKFNDNWATNVTAAGALLTGIFGATTAKAFLGENAETLTALTTVAAAVALVLVGAAPIVVLATKRFRDKDNKRTDCFTVGGILLAAALVFAAAVAQLYVVAYMAMKMDLTFPAKIAVCVAALLAVALLTVYTWRSLKELLEKGTEVTPKETRVEMQAAALIAKAIDKTSDPCPVQAAADDRTTQAPETARTPAAPARRRSALI